MKNFFPPHRFSSFHILSLSLALILAACSSSDFVPDNITIPQPADAWERATPSSVGFDEAALDAITDDIRQGEFGPMDSVLIARNEKLVYENYPSGGTRIHPIYSVTKSVTSLLVGIALDRGDLDSLQSPVLSFFPEYTSLANPHPWKEQMTVEHLLQMRAGYLWDELSASYNDAANPTQALTASPDWMKFMLDQPMDAQPGETFVYNSGVTMLLSGILEKATGMTVERYANQHLFQPLGILYYDWTTTPRGLSNTGWGLDMQPEDMAKIGQLCLDNGDWRGTRVVSANWLDQSIQAHSRFQNGGGYGYQWWLLAQPQTGDPVGLLPYAHGWGSQHIFFDETRDMVIVTTASNFAVDATWRIPALVERIQAALVSDP